MNNSPPPTEIFVRFGARDLYLKIHRIRLGKHFTRNYVIHDKYYPEIKPLVLLRRLLEKKSAMCNKCM